MDSQLANANMITMINYNVNELSMEGLCSLHVHLATFKSSSHLTGMYVAKNVFGILFFCFCLFLPLRYINLGHDKISTSIISNLLLGHINLNLLKAQGRASNVKELKCLAAHRLSNEVLHQYL